MVGQALMGMRFLDFLHSYFSSLSAVLQNLIGVAHNYWIPEANLHARLNCDMQRIEAIILLSFETFLITVKL
jgi:hypothetical protein